MGQPNILVPVALVAFLLATAACFSLLGPRRAVVSAMLGGWLFLPHLDSRTSFFVLSSKAMFVPAVVILGSIAFDGARWLRLRPRLLDLPMAVLCLVPFATALQNGLGAYEAASATFETAMSWGAPYLLGRLYLGGPGALDDLAHALVVAALVYVPFCLWEVRMSPQLHFAVYGYRPWGFSDTLRFGGYRPSVFMQHGLAVGMFMAVSTLVAFWLWRTGARRTLQGVPLAWVFGLLLVTTVLCKSTGATVLLAVGVGALEVTRRRRTAALLLALALVPPAYAAARISGWDAEAFVPAISRAINPERAQSVQFRIDSEKLLIRKAMLRPWLGWGRFGRSFVYDEEGERQDLVITDSLFVIVLGVTGLVGLIAMGLVLALPPLLLLRTYPARHWADPRLASAAALAVVVLLWAIDDLANAMLTPVYPAIAGAIVSLVLVARAARAGQTRPAHPRGSRLASQRSS